jgi:hypothetical protein
MKYNIIQVLKIVALLTLVIILGCSSVNKSLGRGVYIDQSKNEFFYSTEDPRIILKFDEGLKYIGHIQEEKFLKYIDGIGGSFHVLDYYLFVEPGANNRIERVVTIKINKIKKGSVRSDLFDWIKPNFDSGTKDILGETYQVGATVSSLGIEKDVKFIEDKGYIIPNSFLIRCFGKRLGLERNIAFYVYYAEDLSGFKEGNYKNIKLWQDSATLKFEQKEILKNFLTRADKCISWFEYDELSVTSNKPTKGE